jgi:TetR/AcrR family transcriptional repressor of nem operon
MIKANKELETKKHIVKTASQGFRSHGYAGIGVDSIAKEAGVASGGYVHLGSKDGVFEALLSVGLEKKISLE